jgi:hypothetical protein
VIAVLFKWSKGRQFAGEPSAQGKWVAAIVERACDQTQGSGSGVFDSGSPVASRYWTALIPTWYFVKFRGQTDDRIEAQRLNLAKKRDN